MRAGSHTKCHCASRRYLPPNALLAPRSRNACKYYWVSVVVVFTSHYAFIDLLTGGNLSLLPDMGTKNNPTAPHRHIMGASRSKSSKTKDRKWKLGIGLLVALVPRAGVLQHKAGRTPRISMAPMALRINTKWHMAPIHEDLQNIDPCRAQLNLRRRYRRVYVAIGAASYVS